MDWGLRFKGSRLTGRFQAAGRQPVFYGVRREEGVP
jgi:hypothetical protein